MNAFQENMILSTLKLTRVRPELTQINPFSWENSLLMTHLEE